MNFDGLIITGAPVEQMDYEELRKNPVLQSAGVSLPELTSYDFEEYSDEDHSGDVDDTADTDDTDDTEDDIPDFLF